MVANMRVLLHNVALLISVSQVSAFLQLEVDQDIERDHDLDAHQNAKADYQLDADQQLDAQQQHDTESDAELRLRLVDGMTDYEYRRHILRRGMNSEQLFNLIHYGLQTEMGKRNYSLVDLSQLAVNRNQTEVCSLPVEWQETLTCGDKVGQGSFGTVYKAIVKCADAEADEMNILAVKQQTLNEGTAEQFELETKILSEVAPGLSPYLTSTVGGKRGVRKVGNKLYLLTEFLNAGDYEHYQSGPRLEWKLPLLVHVLKGMHALHDAKYVHLDMKPANVMVHCKDGIGIPSSCYAQVIDVGLALPIGNPTGKTAQGTPLYMAPEVWTAGYAKRAMPVDPKNDVFAVGAMLYMDGFGVDDSKLPWANQLMLSKRWNVERDPMVNRARSSKDPFSKKLGETLLGMLCNDPSSRSDMITSIADVEALVRLFIERNSAPGKYCRSSEKVWSKTNFWSKCSSSDFSDDYCPIASTQYCFKDETTAGEDYQRKGVCCCAGDQMTKSTIFGTSYTATAGCNFEATETQLLDMEKSPIDRGVTGTLPQCIVDE